MTSHVPEFLSLLRLNHIPLHVGTALSLSIHLLWTSSFFFFFSILAIVSNAAVNMGVQISKTLILILLDEYPEGGLLNCMVVLF